MRRTLLSPAVAASLLAALPEADAGAMTPHELFSDEVVHEIDIVLPYTAWFDTLSRRKQAESYVAGEVWVDGERSSSVGVRFKGNSSWGHPGIKKPFKLKFDAFESQQTFANQTTLSLNNNYHDATMMRETIAYELYRNVGIASRTGYANVRVNDELIGFYTLVENVNRAWTQDHVAADEDGTLWKVDPNGDLRWRGETPDSYRRDYQLETNEEDDDWSDFIDWLDALNHTPIDALPDSLRGRVDVDAFLRNHAITITLVSLDSYEGRAHNYYLYHRDDRDQFLHIPWDLNSSFGTHTLEMSTEERRNMSPLWTYQQSRPLVDRLLEVPLYEEMYLRHLRDLLNGEWSEEAMDARIDRLRDWIRPHVYADPNKMYRNQDFEDNIEHDLILDGRRLYFGLRSFVGDRTSVIQPVLDARLHDQQIFINELLADNRSAVADSAGEFDDFAELYNGGTGGYSLEGYGLTDDHTDPFQWVLPSEATLSGGGHLILWLDGDPDAGPLHAPFALNATGEELFLFDRAGALVDFVAFDRQRTDIAWGRRQDGGPTWGPLVPSAGEPNPDNAPPFIEEAFHGPVFPGPGEEGVVETYVTDFEDDPLAITLVYDAGEGDVELEMNETEGRWTASLPRLDPGTSLDYYLSVDDGGTAVVRWPPAAPEERIRCTFTVGVAPIALNEFLADNGSGLKDGDGEFDDWIEVVNVSDHEVDLTGFHLSDDPQAPTRWAFPEGSVLSAGERILIWADDEPVEGELHADFKLSKSGETLTLFGPGEGSARVVDSVAFGAQATDQSEARLPDGLGNWTPGQSPSPDQSNGGGVVVVIAPFESPVVIPAGGGGFEFQATVFNRSQTTASMDAWTLAVTGRGEVAGLGPSSISIEGESRKSARLRQSVPGEIGNGDATYELRAGSWPDRVESSDSFPVTKE